MTAAVRGAAETTQLPHVAQRGHTSLGLLAIEAGDAAAARTAFERAVELIEPSVHQLPAEEFRTAFAEDKLVPYLELVRLALAKGTRAGVDERSIWSSAPDRGSWRTSWPACRAMRLPADAVEKGLLRRVDMLRQELGWLYGRVHRLDLGGDVSASRRGHGAGVSQLEAEVRTREAELQELRGNWPRPDGARAVTVALASRRGRTG